MYINGTALPSYKVKEMNEAKQTRLLTTDIQEQDIKIPYTMRLSQTSISNGTGTECKCIFATICNKIT
jgi:hypothetical protein